MGFKHSIQFFYSYCYNSNIIFIVLIVRIKFLNFLPPLLPKRHKKSEVAQN